MRKWKGSQLRLFAVVGWLMMSLFWAQPAQAHPADMLFQYHAITLTRGGVEIEWSIYPGYLLVPRTWNEADGNADGQVTSQEAEIWAQQRRIYLSVQINSSAPVALQLKSVRWPSSLSAFQVGQEVITISLSGTWPLALVGDHTFTLRNQFEPNTSIYAFDIRSDTFDIDNAEVGAGTYTAALAPATGSTGAESSGNTRGQPDVPGPVAKMLLPAPTQAEVATSEEASRVEAVEPTPTAPGLSSSQMNPGAASQPGAILAGLVTSSDLSPGFYLIALAASLGLGALHALTPGHGKTIVAAYLVGAQGTIKHAVALGGITTLTHTGSVLLLGVATLVASRYFLPTAVFPVLEVASGVLIVGLGVSLLWQRWDAWRSGGVTHSHTHDHHHDHSHPHTHADHHHHRHDVPETVTWRSLIGLGVSGGLVPCPDAIAILLVAVAIHRIGLGLALILAFSLGLALVLIAIGVAIVHGTRMLARFDAFGRIVPILPVISAAAVILLGSFLVLSAIRTQESITPPPAPEAASASPTPPPLVTPTAYADDDGSVLYLSLDANGNSQLARIAPRGGDPAILTAEPYGVRDYTVDPDGSRIVYSAWRSDRGSDLWYLPQDGSPPSRLLACRQSACSSPIWLPDHRRMIYLLQFIPLPGAALSAPSLWSLDTQTGTTGALAANDDVLGANPQLSPDGRWLAYETPARQILRILDLNRMQSIDIENTMGGNIAWRPDSHALVMTGVVETDGQFHNGLWSIDPATGRHVDLAPAPDADDRLPVWSPDGRYLAFVRHVQVNAGDFEAQVWLVGADGRNAYPLVSGQPYAFDGLDWSPDGQTLLAEARLLTAERTIPSLWRIDVTTGGISRLTTPGLMATWVP